MNLKIQFDKSKEQAELIKNLGLKGEAGREALAAFVTLMGPTLNQVLLQADTTGNFFRTLTFAEGENPFLALEPYADVNTSEFAVWSAPMPGGLPTNFIYRPIDIIPFLMRRMDTAVSYLKALLLKGGAVDYVAAGMQRMMQELMLKDQNDAWFTILAALGQAGQNVGNLRTTLDASNFTLDDWNKTLTDFRRINKSWVGGTPIGGTARPTDAYLSPGMMEKVRSFAYQPINTKAPNNITATAASGAVTLQDAERAKLFTSAGIPSFFDVDLHELLELEGSYNTILSGLIASPTTIHSLTKDDGTTNTVDFSTGILNTILFVDANRDFAFKAVQTNSNGEGFNLLEDDQFPVRSDKVGVYGYSETGRIITDIRPLFALILH